jgi:hypothetical protein
VSLIQKFRVFLGIALFQGGVTYRTDIAYNQISPLMDHGDVDFLRKRVAPYLDSERPAFTHQELKKINERALIEDSGLEEALFIGVLSSRFSAVEASLDTVF